jgi:hypothetical protein
VRLGTGMVLAGIGAATAATAIASTPAEAAKVDVSYLIVHGRSVRQAGSVGLDHSGGDLRRAVKITRRAQSDPTVKRASWAAIAPMPAKQASVSASLTP